MPRSFSFLTGLIFATAAAVPLLAAPPAWAGRPPTAEERARIETALRGLGYVRWDDIEFEHGVWEIDDARAADGREYDLKLNPDTLAVVEREPD
ncbi:PepSY domain-containing protein [Dankookia sp. GCM10030260]|uniref:PepSY domain-containing protein n=1 Tax=Dankookia sp. GCM10030260 TaxID=3273390 RepID=UPI0036072A86